MRCFVQIIILFFFPPHSSFALQNPPSPQGEGFLAFVIKADISWLPLEGKACAKLCYNSHSIQIHFTIIPHFFQRLFFFKIKSGCVQGDFLNQVAHGPLLSFITSLFQAFPPLYRPRRVHNANTDAFCNIPAYARSAPTTPQQHDVPTADGSSLSRFFG